MSKIYTYQIEVVADEQHDEVILGRDILNHLVVILNGPGSSVEVVGD